MICLFVRTYKYIAVSAYAKTQAIGVKIKSGCDDLMLIHHDLHHQISGTFRASKSRECIFVIWYGNKLYHFIKVIFFLFRNNGNCAVRPFI